MEWDLLFIIISIVVVIVVCTAELFDSEDD